MINCIGIEALSAVILNLTIAISILMGGIWAYLKFVRRKESAAVLLKITDTKVCSINEGSDHGLILDVHIANKGNRDVVLKYDSVKLSIYKCTIEGAIRENITEVSKIQTKMEIHNGRLRAGAEISLPFWVQIMSSGLFFIEFEIDIDVKSYYKGLFTNETNKIIKFSDRIYFPINEIVQKSRIK